MTDKGTSESINRWLLLKISTDKEGVKMMRRKSEYLCYLIGIMVLTLGVSLTVKSGLGAGSLDAINFALSDKLNINISIVILIVSILAILISSLIRRGKPKLTTLVTAIFMAIFTEFGVFIVSPLTADTLFKQALIFLIAIMLCCIGIALYLMPKLPANPNDDMVVSIHEVTGIKIGTAKLILDIICIIIALFLKSPIGIGTLLLTVFVGPGVNLVTRFFEKILIFDSKNLPDIKNNETKKILKN